ncbi:MAG: ABC transporter permease [Pigmentiphaga sp.]|uniref:ABC transporter permease n=1 Tax=Pigmentiphaga sp. TaxID=1977564 RepID=UPI0029BED8DB|nr:ABC transporter permease [Pigmentiphaga sp.]MDX3904909.1 ABC transporter permease [Pigmentiphaga sp.]
MTKADSPVGDGAGAPPAGDLDRQAGQPGTLDWDASGPGRLAVRGDWTLAHHARLRAQLGRVPQGKVGVLALQDLAAIDTAGAALLAEAVGPDKLAQWVDADPHLDPARRALLGTVARAATVVAEAAVPRREGACRELLGRIGRAAEVVWNHVISLFGFIGLTLQALVATAFRPRRWRLTATVAQIDQTGLDAVPIIALLTFMVGAVVAFLGATVLREFGATLYTVDLVGFAFLREFAVLLTAILMAGRTASAFTAQIGSMKANEEIDAIRAQGLDPINLLVLPRVMALLISLPLLTFLAMLTGIAGGMAVCAVSLDIPPAMFLGILRENLGVGHFLVGMVKAPVFAFVIAVIGCLEGFKVSGSAQSVGEHTTSSVVQCIFVVILLDALAALFFMEMGW